MKENESLRQGVPYTILVWTTVVSLCILHLIFGFQEVDPMLIRIVDVFYSVIRTFWRMLMVAVNPAICWWDATLWFIHH